MLTDKYLWNITQNFKKYSDILENIKTIEDENIGSYCKIFKRIGEPDIIYIWFKGTELSIKDLLVDMFFFKKKLNNKAKVHAGFWSAVESIYYLIHRYLIDNIEQNQQIVIFGHSLGAAMAKEFARQINGLLDNLSVITFGTPRTGNKYYAEFFNNLNTKEYLISSDPIGWLPLRIMNYKHTNKIIKIKKWIWGAHQKYGEFLE